MKKILLSFLCCMLAVIGMQAQDLVYTLEPTTGSNNSYAGNCDITIDGITWNLTGNSTMIPWRMGGKNLTNVDRALYSKTAINEAVGKVVLTVGTASSITVNSAKLLVADNAQFDGATDYVFTFKASSDIEIPVNAPSGSYFKFVFNVSVGGSNKFIQITRAKFYAPEGGEGGETPDPVDVPEPTFSVSAGEVEQGDEVAISVEGEYDIYYSTTGDVEANYSLYTDAIAINETTTIYAYAQDAEGNKSDVVSAQYTVFIPVEGTWTLVTDANTLCNGDEVVIVAKDYDVALSTNAANGNFRTEAPVTKEGNDVKFTQDVQVITLGEVGTVEGVRTWSMLTADGYLYSPGTSNYLKTDADNNAAWSIAIGDEATGYASEMIDKNNATATPANVMRYNEQNPRFSCYKANNSQKDVVMYRKVREANIAATMYYLLPGVWETPDAPWYAAYFYNQNNGTAEWVRGFLSNHIVYFDLKAAGSFTHITFCRMNPAYQEMTFDAAPVTRSSDPEARIWDKVTVAYTGEAPVYSIDDEAWTAVATGVEGVEATNGIAYANGIVAAEGAIEVYNVNGMVVARGNESLDLRNLNAGVYIVRNGNNVRKVVR